MEFRKVKNISHGLYATIIIWGFISLATMSFILLLLLKQEISYFFISFAVSNIIYIALFLYLFLKSTEKKAIIALVVVFNLTFIGYAVIYNMTTFTRTSKHTTATSLSPQEDNLIEYIPQEFIGKWKLEMKSEESQEARKLILHLTEDPSDCSVFVEESSQLKDNGDIQSISKSDGNLSITISENEEKTININDMEYNKEQELINAEVEETGEDSSPFIDDVVLLPYRNEER